MKRAVRARLVLAMLGLPLALAACGSMAMGHVTAARAPVLARWRPFIHVARPLDLVGPRAGGSLILAANARLFVLSTTGAVRGLAGATYRSPGGEEPYIAVSPGGCFGAGTVYALRLSHGRGVVAIASGGRVSRFAAIGAPGLIDGIAFDTTGHFGHRLLVTVNAGNVTTVVAIDCHGRVTTITTDAPRVEGGIAVAPANFGRFGGDLVAPGEQSGQLWAISPRGQSLLVANSGLPHGSDIGVESEAFVPRGSVDAFVADRLTPGNRHPGDDVILRIRSAALRAAGVRAGDLLVVTEGAALTDAIRCSRRGCSVRYVANGPAVAHVEGHVAFARGG
jgi:hypothetical protein